MTIPSDILRQMDASKHPLMDDKKLRTAKQIYEAMEPEKDFLRRSEIAQAKQAYEQERMAALMGQQAQLQRQAQLQSNMTINSSLWGSSNANISSATLVSNGSSSYPVWEELNKVHRHSVSRAEINHPAMGADISVLRDMWLALFGDDWVPRGRTTDTEDPKFWDIAWRRVADSTFVERVETADGLCLRMIRTMP